MIDSSLPYFFAAAPEIFLLSAICVVLLVDIFLKDEQRIVTYYLSLVALIGTAAVSALYALEGPVVTFDGSYIADAPGNVLKMAAYLVVSLVFLYSRQYLMNAGIFKGEYYLLGLFGLLGVMVMISAHSLLTIYLGLELFVTVPVCLGGLRSQFPACGRIRHEVLRPRCHCLGHAVVWNLPHLRHHRHLRAGPTSSIAYPRRRRTRYPGGAGLRCRRYRLQVWRRALSHVVARCLRRIADTGDALYRYRTQAGGVCPGLAGTHRRTGRPPCQLAGHAGGPGRFVHGFGNVIAIAQTNLKRMLAYSTIPCGLHLAGFIAGTEEGCPGRCSTLSPTC